MEFFGQAPNSRILQDILEAALVAEAFQPRLLGPPRSQDWLPGGDHQGNLQYVGHHLGCVSRRTLARWEVGARMGVMFDSGPPQMTGLLRPVTV